MADRPIIFSAPMVRALVEGRKTQTRRILSPRNTTRDGGGWPRFAPFADHDWNDVTVDPGPSITGYPGPFLKVAYPAGQTRHRVYPVVQPGDRLYVREAHAIVGNVDPGYVLRRADGYEAECRRLKLENCPPESELRWRPSIHMPRWASRLTLHVTDVRVERLQDISEADAKAEGIFERHAVGDDAAADAWTWQREGWRYSTPREAFRALWVSINGEEAWAASPWVAVISFRVVRANIDAAEARSAAEPLLAGKGRPGPRPQDEASRSVERHEGGHSQPIETEGHRQPAARERSNVADRISTKGFAAEATEDRGATTNTARDRALRERLS